MRFWTERLSYLEQFARTHRVLHLGPGRGSHVGITVDRARDVKPMVVADLCRTFPFREASFDAVYAFSVLEHLPNFFDVMAEIHRVLKPSGFLALLTPHFSDDASFVDPTHVLHLSVRSFDYVIEGTPLHDAYGFYSKPRFRVIHRLLMLKAPWNRVPAMQRFVNRAITFYEQHLCYLIRAAGIYVELEAIKGAPDAHSEPEASTL